jgi:putative methionine-R-sulfoxide reductase with GAF domain
LPKAEREILTDLKNKPSLDEQTFSKLLEAAFVLQEHNREMRQMETSLELQSEQLRRQDAEAHAALQSGSPGAEDTTRTDADYTLTLAEIVEAQRQIQIRHLKSEQAMAIIAERIARITKASGAGIAILDGKVIRYHAGAGAPSLPVGSEVPLENSICAMCVRTGQVLRTPDVNTEFLFDPALCHPRGILSLVAVPVYHDGNIVGALELYFDRLQGYAEQDIHTCQLMAGLVTEAIGRASESAMKKAMAEEHSSMLAAIEKLRPSLAAIAKDATAEISSDSMETPVASAGESVACWNCGNKLIAEEQFCGGCGAARDTDGNTLQSKLASAWNRQQPSQEGSILPYRETLPSGDSIPTRENGAHPRSSLISSTPEGEKYGSPEARAVGADAGSPESSLKPIRGSRAKSKANGLELPATSIDSPPKEITWSSAAKTRDFLQVLSEAGPPSGLARFWRARRGDFYLAVAVLLVAIVIRWGILSDSSIGASGGGTRISTANRRKVAPNADLSPFDKLLISLGLADPPEAPEYRGNPDTQVWIDTHTALYYCPGSELFGKTPNGRFASQRDAQLDQFESASRRACD